MLVRNTFIPEMRVLIRRIPLTVWIGTGFGSIWLLGVALGLPPVWPEPGHAIPLNLHFFGPIVIAILFQFLITLIYSVFRIKQTTDRHDAYTMIKLFPLFILAVFLYFNFKAWTPLVRPVLYDETLYQTDLWLQPVVNACINIRRYLDSLSLPISVNMWYGLLFYLLFFLSFGIHTIIDSGHLQRQFVLGLCLNLMVGGLSYWILPSLGPFLYRTGENQSITNMQAVMLSQYLSLRETGVPPGGYFTIALGAMPSLHVGHALFLLLWAAWRFRPLLIIYVPIFLFILIEAVASGFHYVLDLPAGALLAVFSFTTARWLVDHCPLREAGV